MDENKKNIEPDEREFWTIDEMINSLQHYKEQFSGDMKVTGPNGRPVIVYYDVMNKKLKVKELKDSVIRNEEFDCKAEDKYNHHFTKEWTHPITGETMTEEVTVTLSDEKKMSDDLEKQWNIDLQKLLDTAAKNELEFKVANHIYNAVVDYALKNDKSYHQTLKKNDFDEIVDKQFRDFARTCECPIMCTNSTICNILRINAVSEEKVNASGIVPVSVLTLEYPDYTQKQVTLFWRTVMHRNDTNAILYDMNNPKNCMYIIFDLKKIK